MEHKLQNLKWKHANDSDWFTPGGDPLWCCPVCGEGKHVYGIETPVKQYVCKDCGALISGYE